MRALVFGARGMLATDLVAAPPENIDVIPLGRDELDITDAAAIAGMLDRYRPDWVVNASAYTRVDQAEIEYAVALEVNGAAVSRLGRACADRGTRVVHFGTDYVFAGDGDRPYRETDPVAPVNAYGRSKLAGEEGLIASGAHALILRTQWLFGSAGRSFPRTMWDRATRGLPTRVVADQFGRPTASRDLAQATWDLVLRDASGLFHVANRGEVASWFDVARMVFDAAGAPDLLSPCATSDYPTPARRPAYSPLDSGKVMSHHGISLPDWHASLGSFLTSLSTGSA